MTETCATVKNIDKVNTSDRIASYIQNGLNLKKEIFVLAFFYTLMHGGILLIPNAIFWDDWVLYRTDPSIVLDTFRQAGSMFNWTGHLHVTMLSVGPWSYKALTFILMFASGLLLNSILERNALLTKNCRFFVVLLFLILPFNLARVALIDFPYTLRYFLFFLAWRLMTQHRLSALFLFFLSFSTNSLLMFYALPILDMAHRGGHLASSRSLLLFIFRRLDFLLLPFLFILIKVNFFSPYGLYAGYNQHFDLANISYAVEAQAKDFSDTTINFYIFFVLMPFVFLATKQAQAVASYKYMDWKLLVLIVVGIAAFILGAFPYWLLGHVPTFQEWASRHQLLLPLGTALTIVSILFLLRPRYREIGLSVVIAASLSYGIENYYSFFIDWNKQTALVTLFSENQAVRNSNLIVLDDKTLGLNAISRRYRFYEWNGLLEKAYDDQSRFVIEPHEIARYWDGAFNKYFSAHYKAASHIKDKASPAIFVEIRQAPQEGPAISLRNVVFPRFTLSVRPLAIAEPAG